MQSPKWLPILISVIALGVSGLSLWESHRSRTLNEDVNRPVLQLTDVTHNTISSNGKGFARLRINLKNIGRATAMLETWKVIVMEEAIHGCKLVGLNPNESVESGVQRKEIPQGLSEPLV